MLNFNDFKLSKIGNESSIVGGDIYVTDSIGPTGPKGNGDADKDVGGVGPYDLDNGG